MQKSNTSVMNEDLSLADKLNMVLRQLKARREEIADVLPPDIPFDHFHAVVNQALRNNPDVLKATPLSIVNACVKSAYDGLRLDGREAALVTHKVKASKNPDRWEDRAQYFPMVFGLVQQVLRGGEVIALEASIIYQNDEYRIQRGTNAGIHHVPNISGDRGEPIAAYSVATYKGGYVGFEFMTKAQILDVRAASKSGEDQQHNPTGIWKRWPDSMWKKTVIRQHRKTLPMGGRDIYDAEQQDDFDALPGAQAGQPAIPARPTRTTTALEYQPGGEGVALDLAVVSEHGELIEAERTAPADGRMKKAAAPDQQELRGTDDGLPEDEAAWAAWAADIEKRLTIASTIDAVRAIEVGERARIEAANEARRGFIKGFITDRLADIASEATADEASGSED